MTKTIEVTRINLFNIITQYRAIFPHEETNPTDDPLAIDSSNKSLPLEGLSCNGDRFFQAWLHEKVNVYILISNCVQI